MEAKRLTARMLRRPFRSASLSELGRGRIKLLAVITSGHFGIHWFQQLFPVVLPSLKAELGLTDVQVGALSSVRQLVNGGMDLPCGIMADSLARHRAPLLASALLSMGVGYSLMGIMPAFGWLMMASGLIGLGTALWHPAAAASLSNSFPERRATALSIHGMGATVSDTLTPLIAGFLLVSLSWQSFLAAQSVPALTVALLLWAALAGQFEKAESPAALSTHLREMVEIGKNLTFVGITVATAFMQMGRAVVLAHLSSGTSRLFPIRTRCLYCAPPRDGDDFPTNSGAFIGPLWTKNGFVAVFYHPWTIVRAAGRRGSRYTAGSGRRWHRSFLLYTAECYLCRRDGCCRL
jgi:MFS family permease